MLVCLSIIKSKQLQQQGGKLRQKAAAAWPSDAVHNMRLQGTKHRFNPLLGDLPLYWSADGLHRRLPSAARNSAAARAARWPSRAAASAIEVRIAHHKPSIGVS